MQGKNVFHRSTIDEDAAFLQAHHEFIKLALLKTVRVVLQSDLIGLAPLAVDLQKHLCVRPCPLHI